MNQPLDNLNKYELILASGSPRRRELLGMLDLDFKIDTSYSIDESVPAGVAAIDVAPYLSGMKAMAFPLTENDRKLVITADFPQCVFCGFRNIHQKSFNVIFFCLCVTSAHGLFPPANLPRQSRRGQRVLPA